MIRLFSAVRPALLAALSLVLLALAPASASAATCPCSLFGPFDTPVLSAADDSGSIEVGMRFRADTAGYVKGVRFHKGAGNTGTHTGSLWTNGGTLLGTATFTGESASGWQQVLFETPIAVAANTTYVVSYHAPLGHYSASLNYFGSSHYNDPLLGLADGTDGANGVYSYSSTTTFPTSSFNSANYWVDVVWDVTDADTTAPTVSSTTPVNGATAASKRDVLRAYFSEPVDPTTISSSTLELRTSGGALVPSTISWDSGTNSAIIDPTATLAPTQGYVAKVKGGATNPTVRDVAGNALAADYTWSFTTAGVEPQDGPGGPVLVLTDPANPYTYYYAEILRAEGLNLFATADVDQLSSTLLDEHDVVIVGDLPLTSTQAGLLSDWVTAGGNLVAMRPDSDLAGLAGITPAGTTLANAYLKVDTDTEAGKGIVAATIQYHGTADRYTLDGASAVASLYSDATTATSNPAVTLRSVGTAGGQVATFTFDLARSIVQTRQGNPAWIGQDRDGQAPVRSNDLFYGAKTGDVQPDWVNLDKVAIPQADEQQRLLANLVTRMTEDSAPTPRFWYLPSGRKAAIVHALDDHGTPTATKATFDHWKAESPSGCSVAAWECYRATSWFYRTIPLTNSEAVAYHAEGFDLGSHIDTGCTNFTSAAGLDASFASDLGAFASTFPGLPPQTGNRTHCIPWSDWDSIAKVSLARGIRIDMGYYYWPGSWVQNRPGFFTGSGFPMRYAETNGSMIDVYQLTNQLVNENGQSYPTATNALLDRALGEEAYYGVFGTHDDYSGGSGFSDGILASAKARGVAVVSADQMLKWTDGRNASAMRDISWNGSALTFTVTPGTGAIGLTGMVPTESDAGELQGLTRNGDPVTTETRIVKGVSYAFYPATTGVYVASYRPLTLFEDAVPVHPADADDAAVEVGMRFKSDVDGTVTGVRFYKGTGNTGTHVGNLWTAGGTLLSSVTFTNETASGWQRANFATPVAISANITYVVSYHAPNGHYAGDTGAFTTGIDNAPLHAPASTGGAPNGVYKYGSSSAFPTDTWEAANYWVDVTFRPAPEEVDPEEPTCPCTVFAPAATPGLTAASDTDAVELGMRFTSEQAGTITGVRFYKGTGNTGTHTGSLWTAGGTLLATATFTDETSSGWQQVTFSSPVAITADTQYVVSYFAPNGHYAADSGYFATSGVDRAPLHAPASTGGAGNGLYRYGSTSGFPNSTFAATNYWVDAVFETGAADTTAPTVTAVTPAASATGVSLTSNVTATFSEALAAASVTTSTVVLRDAASNPVTATVTYDAPTKTVTIDPSAALATSTTYTASLVGGSSGARITDAAGNALATTYTWSFTTAASATTYSLFGTGTPTNASAADTDAVELGMKWQSDVAGTVTAIRFYKGSTNTGTHTGHLWTAGGTLLASVTFTGETSSGWQQAELSSPVSITANTTYVVSYHAPNGHYAADYSAFSSAIDAAPLHGLANGASGGNGVFTYGSAGSFPTSNWMATNYWVDVVFAAS